MNKNLQKEEELEKGINQIGAKLAVQKVTQCSYIPSSLQESGDRFRLHPATVPPFAVVAAVDVSPCGEVAEVSPRPRGGAKCG